MLVREMRSYHTCYHTALEEFQVVNRARLNFINGDTVGVVRCITVGILDDTKIENNEQFNFTLSSGMRTQFNQASSTIYIIEDDGMIMYMLIILALQVLLSIHSGRDRHGTTNYNGD